MSRAGGGKEDLTDDRKKADLKTFGALSVLKTAVAQAFSRENRQKDGGLVVFVSFRERAMC
jgi:hypothetical protein